MLPCRQQARLSPPEIDLPALRRYRLGRLREQMAAADAAACILVSPVSLRYALDVREYQLFQAHIPSIYAFVGVDGPVRLHAATGRSYPAEVQHWPSRPVNVFDGGLSLAENARLMAEDLDSFLTEVAGTDTNRLRVGIEMMNPSVGQALLQKGFEVVEAEVLVEQARCIKSSEELALMAYAIEVANKAMDAMYVTMAPGVSEVELLSVLHQVNISHGGDWCDGRMLSSGTRTNPWLQEASDRIFQAGEIVAFDTDMIGPFGYCADISRTWVCPGRSPTSAQRGLFSRARDEIEANLDLLAPGLSFREFSHRAFVQPEEYSAHRYPCVAHGVGLSDEYPKVYYRQDWDRYGYDGTFEPGMVICLESFVGSEHGGEGVKLEQMVRVTESGTELLSLFPVALRL